MKYLLSIVLLFISVITNGQSKKFVGDTTISKRSLDSLKNELASYKVASFTHLSLYNKATEDKNRVVNYLAISEEKVNDLSFRLRRQNLRYGGFFLTLTAVFIFSIKQFTANIK